MVSFAVQKLFSLISSHLLISAFISFPLEDRSKKYIGVIYISPGSFVVFSLTFQRRQWHPTPVLLPGKSHGRRSLVGCSPWGHKESDTTERLHFHFSLSWTGEGNGNPLQCSCLENPRDGGAWWAAVHGVAQSRTRLKRLSSSSNSSSSLTFRSLMHMELSSVYSVWECSNFILLHVPVPFSHHHLVKNCVFPTGYSCLPYHRWTDRECMFTSVLAIPSRW